VKKTVFFVLSLFLLILSAMGRADDSSVDVYFHWVTDYYYHVDPVCPMVEEMYLPMTRISKLDFYQQEHVGTRRPCIHCAFLESVEFYNSAGSRYTEKEIEIAKWWDEINLKLMDRDSLTFKDWAEMFPGTYTVPSQYDLSPDEAVRIAILAIHREYGVGIEEASTYHSVIRCVPNFGPGLRDEENGYLIQFGNDEYPLLFTIQMYADTGEVVYLERVVGGD